MYDHIGLRVKDVKKSARFYAAALEPLGVVTDSSGTGFGPPGAPALWLTLEKGPAGRGAHIAVRASDHAAVDQFYKQGLQAGGRDNGAPGLRKDYSPKYYAAFLFDPDGNNVEAVCLK